MSRPDTVQRDTLQNILDTKEYTLNYIQASLYKKAHQTSARYDKGVSEFEKVGFQEKYEALCYAPFVDEAIVKIAMKYEQSIPITLNGTVLIIGSVMQVEIDASLVAPDGYVALSDAEVLISQGLDAYLYQSPLAVYLMQNLQSNSSSLKKNSMKNTKKAFLPHKICPVCNRPFSWRKKWEKVWDEVKFCSEACRMRKHGGARG
jgi:hypothetical protein